MIFHFLTFGRHCAEQSSAGKDQIFSLLIQGFVNQEILLLRTDGGGNTCNILVPEQLQNLDCLCVQSFHGTQQRSLFIQCFAAVRTESGRNVKGSILNKSGGSRIPCRITSCFKSSAQTAGREAGRIRLTLYQLFSGEIHDDLTISDRTDEAVMLFGSETGHGLEPVRIMGSTVLNCPFLHGNRNGIGNIQFQMSVIFDCFTQRFVNILGELFAHHFVVKDQAAVNFRNTF